MKTGELVTLYRNQAGMTIDELVDKSGIPKGTLNKIISGDTKAPSFNNIKAIADALGKTLEDFATDEEGGGNVKTPPSRVEPDRGEEIGTEETYQFLVSSGLVEEGLDLSDRDLEFLGHIQSLYRMWLNERGQKA